MSGYHANRLVAGLLVVAGLGAVAACGSPDGPERARGPADVSAIPSSEAGTVLFTRVRADGKPALFTVAPDGSHLRLFAVNASSASVSPDGERILFVRGGAIWQMGRDGADQRQVTRPPRSSGDSDPAWSPGGQVVYFSRMVAQGSFAAFSTRADGTGLRRLTRGCVECTGGDDEPAPSPDGRVIAYSSWGHGGGDDWSFLEAMTPTGRRAKLGFRTTDASHEWSPAWAPDGERLAFAALDADAFVSNRVGLSGLYVSTRTAAARRLFRPDARWPYVLEPAWSPDGEWIVFTYQRTDSSSDIWIVTAEGGPGRRVTSGRAVDRGPAWLPPASP
jgi:Tol biopolymer transport system component